MSECLRIEHEGSVMVAMVEVVNCAVTLPRAKNYVTSVMVRPCSRCFYQMGIGGATCATIH